MTGPPPGRRRRTTPTEAPPPRTGPTPRRRPQTPTRPRSPDLVVAPQGLGPLGGVVHHAVRVALRGTRGERPRLVHRGPRQARQLGHPPAHVVALRVESPALRDRVEDPEVGGGVG